MRFVLSLLLLAAFSAHADIYVKSQIHDIDYGSENEDVMVLLKSGHVAWIKKVHEKSKLSLEKDAWFKFTLSEKHHLLAATPIEIPATETVQNLLSEDNYIPTVIENFDLAKKYFKESKYVSKESQCYNRAHIWSYEWFLKHNVYSNKTWVFFTRKYIRKFKFEWWFHVAPSVAVREDDVVREKIMDVKYARGPIDLKRWTDIFMLDDANCPQVKTYSDYANYPESGSCYTMRSSMFYYQPFDIETKETWGTIKANWYETEIKQAYLEAFNEEI